MVKQPTLPMYIYVHMADFTVLTSGPRPSWPEPKWTLSPTAWPSAPALFREILWDMFHHP